MFLFFARWTPNKSRPPESIQTLYDLVAYSLVLHVTETPEATLANVARVTRPAETTDIDLATSLSFYNEL
jgi:hypothetical protein